MPGKSVVHHLAHDDTQSCHFKVGVSSISDIIDISDRVVTRYDNRYDLRQIPYIAAIYRRRK